MFWLGAAVSLCYVPTITGAYIATQWPLLSLAMPFVLWRSGVFTRWHSLGLVFLVYAFGHAFFALTPYAAVFDMWILIILALCVWMGSTVTSLRHLYAGLAVGGGVSSVVALLQSLGISWYTITSVDPAGLYVNSTQQGAFLALLVVALVSERMWLWTLPLLPGLALAHSRGALLMLIVGLLACYVRRLSVFALVAIAGVALLWFPLNSHDAERMLIWQTAWHNLTWFGWGPGAFYTLLIPEHGSYFYPEHAHNDALQLAFEYGVGALAAFALFGAALARTNKREWPVIVAFVTAGCYSMPLYMPLTAFVGLCALGRVLRGDVLAIGVGDISGFHVVSRRREDETGCGAHVPVA